MKFRLFDRVFEVTHIAPSNEEVLDRRFEAKSSESRIMLSFDLGEYLDWID